MILYDEMIPGVDWVLKKTNMIASSFRDIQSFDNEALIKTTHCLIRSTTNVNQSLLEKMPVLQWLATGTSGIDHIDQSALMHKNIQWFDAKGSNAKAVADYVIYALAQLNRMSYFSWPQNNNVTAAVVGCGHVGKTLLRSLNHLHFQTLACDPFVGQEELKSSAHLIASSDQFDWIKDVDILSLHLPHTTKGDYPTNKWLNEEKLDLLQDDSIVILAGRGENADETALLNHAHRLHYIMDVWPSEPSVNINLIQASKLSTPHIAGHSLLGKFEGAWVVIEHLFRDLNLPLPCTKTEFIQHLLLETKTSEPSLSFESNIYSPELAFIHKAFQILCTSITDKRVSAIEFSSLRRKYQLHKEIIF